MTDLIVIFSIRIAQIGKSPLCGALFVWAGGAISMAGGAIDVISAERY
jgi:hypothetical protein